MGWLRHLRSEFRSKGEGRQCATMSPGFAFQHRAVTLNAWNRRFAVDLSGARPRHSKGEFLSIICAERRPLC